MNKNPKVPNPHILSFYTNEAAKCMKSRANFTSCVMLASLLEYILMIAYDALPVSASKHKASKRPDLFSLISIAQKEGWISMNNLDKHVDSIRLARELVSTDKLVEYFENNKELPVIGIEVSQVLASSVSEVIKNLTGAMVEKDSNK